MRPLPLAVGSLVLVAVSTAFAEPVILSGRVAYQEVVRLPEGATTLVRMLDEGGMTVAETRIENQSVPPIPFELVYDDAKIADGTKYLLEAEIALAGRTLFRSPKPQTIASPKASHTVSLVVRLVRG